MSRSSSDSRSTSLTSGSLPLAASVAMASLRSLGPRPPGARMPSFQVRGPSGWQTQKASRSTTVKSQPPRTMTHLIANATEPLVYLIAAPVPAEMANDEQGHGVSATHPGGARGVRGRDRPARAQASAREQGPAPAGRGPGPRQGARGGGQGGGGGTPRQVSE